MRYIIENRHEEDRMIKTMKMKMIAQKKHGIINSIIIKNILPKTVYMI